MRIVPVLRFIYPDCYPFIPLVHAIEPAWIYPINGVEIGNIAVSSDGSTIIVAAGNLWFFSKNGTLLKKEPYAQKVVADTRREIRCFIVWWHAQFFPGPIDNRIAGSQTTEQDMGIRSPKSYTLC